MYVCMYEVTAVLYYKIYYKTIPENFKLRVEGSE